MSRFDVTIWGARGTVPVSGAPFLGYGGNTSCVAVHAGDRLVVLDAGSGIVPLGKHWLARGHRRFDVVLSHAHYDHVLGFPFFGPLFVAGADVTLWYAGSEAAPDGEALVDMLLRPPFLPFALADLRCNLQFGRLPASGRLTLEAGLAIATHPVNHPGGSLALAVERAGTRFAYVCDFEHDDGPSDEALRTFLTGADLALLDCTYLPEEYPAYRGFGHSHYERCAEIAAAAGVRRWGAFHHAPTRDDEALDALERRITRSSPAGFVARDGTTFELVRQT